jgi:hypothetical protein
MCFLGRKKGRNHVSEAYDKPRECPFGFGDEFGQAQTR